MAGYIPLPAYRAPGALDFSGLNQGIDALGQQFKENRLLQQQKDIGSAIQSGGYGDGADAAFSQGNISLGTQLAGVEQSDEDRDFNRNRLLAADKRAAAAEGRSSELHGLNVQKTQEDLRSSLIARTAGIAQRIRNETDPQRKSALVQSFVNAHPRLKTQLDAYNFDPANPDPTLDMIIAEAQGLTQPQANEYKTFGADQGIYRAGPSGMEVIREPVPKADRPTTVSPGQRIIDPTTGREIYAAPDKPQALQSVSPGQILYDPATGRPVFTAQPKPEAPRTVSPGQTLVDPATGKEIYAARPKPGAPTEKPPSGYRYSQDGQSLEAIPGGPATKLPSGDAAKLAALQTAEKSFQDAKNFYQESDFFDRGNQLLNRGKAGRAERTVRLAVESALRAMTGAAAPDSEVESYMNLFGPSAWDTPATAKDKLDRLEDFLANVRANIEQGRGPATGAAAPTQGTPQPAQRLRYNPETGELE